ncbi:hypothetical protein DI09_43p30 [Mitosporidium daphniae]|uniref:Uncharacterized protein n=1 Tax=Mitosporidium daphniae TaxID=1485682 RepID=A0A098VQ20_9MICR|nr:uncharacterized protein DI09_43p30 [Mitosporidium daphniae]KGG51128.1 hypothetical protein DI09_43p30 [Mitosporidium daphniae]|eukprot:XP_013237580.1 uncharacterized protein DI09_43p30 [Mitosporidium daphniae]
MISLQFLYGFFVGEVVLFLLVVLILQRSFPRVKRPPSPSPSQKCSPSFAKDGSKVGAFEELSEFFLKIYKSPAENEKHSHITNKVVDLHQRRDEYRSFLTGFDDTIWINEAIQTAFFYYSTSESMHNSIKEGIEKSLFDAAPAFLVCEFDFILGGIREKGTLSHPTITDVYHERFSNDLSDISIRFHLHWDNMGTFLLGADAVLPFKNAILLTLPLGLGIHIDKISGYKGKLGIGLARHRRHFIASEFHPEVACFVGNWGRYGPKNGAQKQWQNSANDRMGDKTVA